MAVKIWNNVYKKVELVDLDKINFDKILISFAVASGATYSYIKLSELCYPPKGKDLSAVGASELLKVKSVADLKKNIAKLAKVEGTTKHPISTISGFYIQDLTVKEEFTSTSANATVAGSPVVPYGLKRTLKSEGVAPSAELDRYIYVQIDGSWTYVHKSNIIFKQGTEVKSYEEWKALSPADKKTITLLNNETGKPISEVYTEKEYTLKHLSHEDVDLDKERKNRTINDQRYEQTEILGDLNKPEKISHIKFTNYDAVADENGQFVAVTVNGHTQMVDASTLFDEDGKPFKKPDGTLDYLMIGKKLKIKQGDAIVATTEKLEYLQAHITYNTRKTYQKVEGDVTENSCLRLTDGKHVKELESVQPMSFKPETDEDKINKYLIKRESDGKYVIVDKEYFKTHSSIPGYDTSHPIGLAYCSFSDPSCAVVQTTSRKDEHLEECSIVKDGLTWGTDAIAKDTTTKKDIFEAFKTGYKEGKYNISYVYLADGSRVEVEDGRYEYTDVAYEEDYADKKYQYKCLKTNPLQIANGKITGGAKFNIGKGIKNSFATYGHIAGPLFGVAVGAGLFIPVAGLVISGAIAIGMAAAVPLIPAINAIYGLVKNGAIGRGINKVLSKFKDKTEHNRAKTEKALNKELQELYSKRDKLNPEQFDIAYAKIMNRIAEFSATTNNCALTVVDGKADVTPENANLANEYIKEFKNLVKQIQEIDKEIADWNKKLKRWAGKASKAAKIAEANAKIAELEAKKADLENKKTALLNTTRGTSYSEDAERKARMEKKAAFVKFLFSIDSSTVLTDAEKARIKLDADNELTIDGIKITATDKEIDKKFKKDTAKRADWVALRTKILGEVETLAAPTSVEPLVGDGEARFTTLEAETATIEAALTELEALFEACKVETEEAIVGLEEYAIATTIKDSAVAEIAAIYTTAKTLTTEAAIRAKIDEIKAKKDNIKTTIRARDTVSTISEVETVYAEARNAVADIATILSHVSNSVKLKGIKLAENDAIFAEIETLYSEAKSASEVKDIRKKIKETKQKLENDLKNLEKEARIIETRCSKFASEKTALGGVISKLEALVDKIADVATRNNYKLKINNIKTNLNNCETKLYSDTVTNVADIKTINDNIKISKEDAEHLLTEIQELDKNSIIDAAQTALAEAQSKFAELDGLAIKAKASTIVGTISTNISTIEALKENTKTATTKEDAIAYKDKAIKISKVISVTVDALKALDEIIPLLDSASAKLYGEYLTKLNALSLVTETTTLKQLDNKESQIRLLVDNIKLTKETLEAEKAKKTKKTTTASKTTTDPKVREVDNVKFAGEQRVYEALNDLVADLAKKKEYWSSASIELYSKLEDGTGKTGAALNNKIKELCAKLHINIEAHQNTPLRRGTIIAEIAKITSLAVVGKTLDDLTSLDVDPLTV